MLIRRDKVPGPVIFLGAGATKSCGGPMTNEILPAIVGGMPAADPAGRMPKLYQFLLDQFHVAAASPSESYPGLPMLMSLLDTALDRRQAFHTAWDANSIVEIREAIELGIFDVLEEKLFKAQTNNHWDLLQKVYPAPAQPCVISTNYDLIIDTAMMFLRRVPAAGRRIARLPLRNLQRLLSERNVAFWQPIKAARVAELTLLQDLPTAGNWRIGFEEVFEGAWKADWAVPGAVVPDE